MNMFLFFYCSIHYVCACVSIMFDCILLTLQEISLSPILSHDPLPPLDSVAAYTRPPRYVNDIPRLFDWFICAYT